MPEIVYVLTNEAMPGLIKIGRTTVDLATRIKELYSSPGVPLPFELFFAAEVADSRFVEAKLHEAFGDHRVSTRREFFKLAPERAKAALSIAMKKEITLGDDQIFETAEDKSDVEAARRRTRFLLSMVGIPPGTDLKLYRDPTIICKTVDETNQVSFKGDVTSLTDAARQAVQDLGLEDRVAQGGPWEWSYQGRRLSELRREIEDKSD